MMLGVTHVHGRVCGGEAQIKVCGTSCNAFYPSYLQTISAAEHWEIVHPILRWALPRVSHQENVCFSDGSCY